MPFLHEAARDVLGLLRAMWAAEDDPDRRRRLAKAGQQVVHALALAETNPDEAHTLVNLALASVRDSMRYSQSFGPIFNAAFDRVKVRR